MENEKLAREERRALVKALFDAGTTNRDIASRLGVSIPTILTDLRALGLRGDRIKFTPELVASLMARLRAGERLGDLAEELGVSTPTLRNNGINLQPEYTGEEIERYIRLRAEGKSIEECAVALGRTHLALVSLSRRRGLAPEIRRAKADKLRREILAID